MSGIEGEVHKAMRLVIWLKRELFREIKEIFLEQNVGLQDNKVFFFFFFWGGSDQVDW